MRPRLVMIGNGMATNRLVDELLARDPGRYEILLIGAEPVASYNRIRLSNVLAGDASMADITYRTAHWYETQGITVWQNCIVTGLDTESRVLQTDSRGSVKYDQLVLATGSSAIRLPVPGVDLPGVVTFRDQADIACMLTAAERGGDAVVIGGGLLGLEAAAGLRRQGMAVTVVHLMPSLMERQLDSAAAQYLQQDLAARGLQFALPAETARIVGAGQVEAVQLRDGRVLPATLVVMAVGIRPQIDLARAAGLACGRGILVDDQLRSSDPNVFALGECVEHMGQLFGLVDPIWRQAACLADVLTGAPDVQFESTSSATSLKVTGIRVFSAGAIAAGAGEEEIVLRDRDQGVYKKLVLRGAQLVGAVLYGDVDDGPRYAGLIRGGESVALIRQNLLFGAFQAAAVPVDRREAAE